MRGWSPRTKGWCNVLKRACHPAGRFLHLRVFLFAAAVPLLMRLKLTRLQLLLEPKKTGRTAEPARVQSIIDYVNAIAALGPPLVRRKCLTRGITLYYFLRRGGLDVALDFGMGNVQGEFLGHCWLVKDGEPFLENQDPRPLYAVMYRISRAAAGAENAGAMDGAWRMGG